MSYAEASLLRVREYARINGLTHNDIAAMSRVWEGSLRRMWDDGFNPTLRTLLRIEAIVPNDFIPLPARAVRMVNASKAER